jgi:hypothetical protein
MNRLEVRAYGPADRGAVRDISFRTGFMGESAASFWRHAESWADVWTSYYTDREPESLSVGATLMRRWLDHLRKVGSPGCHLATLVENDRAVTFFERSGFHSHGRPTPVPGMRGSDGERLHQQIMVRRIEEIAL